MGDDSGHQARIERLETQLEYVRAERDDLARRVATLEAAIGDAQAVLGASLDGDVGESDDERPQRPVVSADDEDPTAGAIQVVGDVDARADDG